MLYYCIYYSTIYKHFQITMASISSKPTTDMDLLYSKTTRSNFNFNTSGFSEK